MKISPYTIYLKMQPNALLFRQNFIICKKWVLHHSRGVMAHFTGRRTASRLPSPQPYKRTQNPSPPRATPLPTLSFLSPALRHCPDEFQVTAIHHFAAPPPHRLSILGKEHNRTPNTLVIFPTRRLAPMAGISREQEL
jgi:hypothetical protein